MLKVAFILKEMNFCIETMIPTSDCMRNIHKYISYKRRINGKINSYLTLLISVHVNVKASCWKFLRLGKTYIIFSAFNAGL